MNKKIFSIQIVLIFFNFLFSLDFSLLPFFEVTYGQLGEYIFAESQTYIVSHLEWEEKPLLYTGLNANFKTGNLCFSASMKTAFPLECGKMYDSDWTSSGVKYTYAIHKNSAKFNIGSEISCYYEFSVNHYFSIIPYAQIQYLYNSFSGHDGYGFYGSKRNSTNGETVSWDSEFATYQKVVGIDYSRHSLWNWLGGGIQLFSANKSFYIRAFGMISLYRYFFSKDYHKSKINNDFTMISIVDEFFKDFKILASFSYTLKKNKLDFLTSVSYNFSLFSKGTLYSDYFWDSIVPVNQISATDFYELSVQSGIQVYL